MGKSNSFEMKFDAKEANESFARHVVGTFLVDANPAIDELEDVKTAVSEAVTNSIVHGYLEKGGEICLRCSLIDRILDLVIEDKGVGIDDIDKALEPFYTTKPDEERSGMGLPLIKSFMSKLEIISSKNSGTTLIMKKILREEEDNAGAQ